VYKPCKTHVVVDALSRLLNITKPIDTFDQIIDASLFYKKHEWMNDVKAFLKIGQIERTLYVQHKLKLIMRVEPFTLNNGELYIMG
jgi:hypothetical protein